MSAESDIYLILSGNAGVIALVGSRIYPDALPEESAYPAVAFVRTSSAPVYSIGTYYYGDDASMTIGCWGKGRASADAVADAVVLALQSAGHAHTGRTAGFDPDTGLFVTTIDVVIFDLP